ncbi:unnamed protein product [Miscanthus lutarioriparius]|uniref:Uncharacterized protein n=1 Tax=Miscanthus lutarioriparius TaxID=422564 RepID=A0A811QXB5_9POAL|nr:unnamed protein product [Miscanthus lutarioriparius]
MALTRMEFYKEHLALASLYLPFAILSLTNGPHAIISYLHAIILQLFSLGHFLHLKEARPLGARLLDIGANHDDCNGMRICLEFGVRGCEIERAVVVQKSTCSGLNRWPFPKPIIVQHYFGGKFIRDEWFTLDI